MNDTVGEQENPILLSLENGAKNSRIIPTAKKSPIFKYLNKEHVAIGATTIVTNIKHI